MTTTTKDNPWGVSEETQAILPTQARSALPPEFFKPPEEEKADRSSDDIRYITATFQGMYFKGVGQNKEAKSFMREVKVPYSCLRSMSMHPAWVFLQVAPELLGKEPGYGGVRNVELVSTTPLPRDLDRDVMLNWTASYDDLMYFIKRYGTNVKYTPTNFKDDGKVLAPKSVTVIPELFTTPTALRGAIKRCLADAEAFDKEQTKALDLWKDPEKTDIRNLNRELKAINTQQ